MPHVIGNAIADSCTLALGYAERLLKDISPSDCARLARPGGQTVESNHPAFIYGHLSLYAPRIIGQLGGDATGLQPSERYLELFSHQACCQDDPEGTIYPPMEEITERLMTGYQTAAQQLRSADDALFAQPNPAEGPMRERFPTLGSVLAFYIGGHFMLHMGQMSAWRRMVGLGPA